MLERYQRAEGQAELSQYAACPMCRQNRLETTQVVSEQHPSVAAQASMAALSAAVEPETIAQQLVIMQTYEAHYRLCQIYFKGFYGELTNEFLNNFVLYLNSRNGSVFVFNRTFRDNICIEGDRIMRSTPAISFYLDGVPSTSYIEQLLDRAPRPGVRQQMAQPVQAAALVMPEALAEAIRRREVFEVFLRNEGERLRRQKEFNERIRPGGR